MKRKVTVSWSGGKDAALALYEIVQSGLYEVVHLHTVIEKETRCVGLHGIGEELIEAQANSLGYPLVKLYLDKKDDTEAYQQLMTSFYHQCYQSKIAGIVFGDIFLEDLKAYREQLLADTGLFSVYPLWKRPSIDLVNHFIAIGFKAIICSAKSVHFSCEDMGKVINQALLAELPSQVDPCGERGEFHTFVYDGPNFKKPVIYKFGKVFEETYNYQIRNSAGTVTMQQTQFLFQNLLLADVF